MHTVVNTLTTNQITEIIISCSSFYKTSSFSSEPSSNLHTSDGTSPNNFHKRHFHLYSTAESMQHRACSTIPFSSCLHNFHYILYYHPCIDCKVFLYHTDTNILIQTLHWYTFRSCFHIMLFNEDIPLHGFVGSVIIYKPA